MKKILLLAMFEHYTTLAESEILNEFKHEPNILGYVDELKEDGHQIIESDGRDGETYYTYRKIENGLNRLYRRLNGWGGYHTPKFS